MVSKARCEQAVQNGYDWYCVHCGQFFRDDDPNVIPGDEHEYGTDRPLCENCDADLVEAEEGYVHA